MGLKDMLFGKQPTPEEMAKSWRSNLRKEMRTVDRQIRDIERAEEKIKREIRTLAKRNDKASMTILAKEMVRSRHAKSRMYSAKAHMNSVQMKIQEQMAQVKVAGAMQASGAVMQSMNALLRLPEIQASMRQMSKEMMKAGIMEEMMDDAMEGLDGEDVEEEAEEETQKVLDEILQGQIDRVGSVGRDQPRRAKAAEKTEEEEEEESMDEVQKRLNALRN
uniref:Charged multivesicular body protein 3 n=1 Tax=Palpitomonas bilix TaxID=652834 RepID=A0A7S3DDW7_9EUKA|mmetsp:Transcript_33596/g.86030  ORF Transcript_33596/g.86030 Transcript_33596/m.86030 type:complete len:220 (+) Transcript_33596:140-799(+)|eukprot:CAMPEP_0113887488 /NCGR_PEP_ID=MMETSP0780_2-20120614/12243_1 /TAXON_ID=652834 /ORGANISM="Palpitomonas bilix" /LENGTH=219 /DNA_ID=CAMNT_0000876029 /DNA_START=103 /DNA_END=762 /DNA_ORIENTATION=+ /assembly_acc=CAM_ASM_000599